MSREVQQNLTRIGADGSVSADFPGGVIVAPSTDIPSGTSAGPGHGIRWVRQTDGAVVASIADFDFNGQTLQVAVGNDPTHNAGITLWVNGVTGRTLIQDRLGVPGGARSDFLTGQPVGQLSAVVRNSVTWPGGVPITTGIITHNLNLTIPYGIIVTPHDPSGTFMFHAMAEATGPNGFNVLVSANTGAGAPASPPAGFITAYTALVVGN